MQSIKEIVIESLPSVHLTRRHQLPQSSGVYFLTDSSGNVLYVGQADNLKVRWSNHHVLKKVGYDQGSCSIHYIEVAIGLLDDVEGYFYQLHRPPLNEKPVLIRNIDILDRLSVVKDRVGVEPDSHTKDAAISGYNRALFLSRIRDNACKVIDYACANKDLDSLTSIEKGSLISASTHEDYALLMTFVGHTYFEDLHSVECAKLLAPVDFNEWAMNAIRHANGVIKFVDQIKYEKSCTVGGFREFFLEVLNMILAVRTGVHCAGMLLTAEKEAWKDVALTEALNYQGRLADRITNSSSTSIRLVSSAYGAPVDHLNGAS